MIQFPLPSKKIRKEKNCKSGLKNQQCSFFLLFHDFPYVS